MFKFHVFYRIEGKAEQQYLDFDYQEALIHPREFIRAIVMHEFPKAPDPFVEGRSGEGDRAIRKYGLSDFKTPVLIPKKRKWRLLDS